MRRYNPNYTPNLKQLHKVVELLKKAKKPLIFAGGGVVLANASEELTWLARALSVPVTTTLMGLGVFPGNDPLCLGMVGMHGTYAANMAMSSADLLISVGARFDDRVTGKLSSFAQQAKIVHIDIDPTSIRKNVSVNVPIVADCKTALQALREDLAEDLYKTSWVEKHGAWLDKLKGWEDSHPMSYPTEGESIKPQAVVEKIYEISQGDAIISTEVGQNQMWAAQFFKYLKPRTLLTSGGLGTMGYGLPAAIGAQCAFPDKLVVDIAGDGSNQMNIQEMATAVSYGLPVKIVILNTGYLGLVRQWQELFYNRNYCSTCLHTNPDFVMLAKAYGAEGIRIEKQEDLEPLLTKAFNTPGPVIVDVIVEPESNVYPMVPAGASLSEMLLV